LPFIPQSLLAGADILGKGYRRSVMLASFFRSENDEGPPSNEERPELGVAGDIGEGLE
jgi:hypothetical protein